jgi:ABC-2 type transport system permease protein
MNTIFRYRVVRLRGQILGWGISLALLGVLLVQFYSTIADQQQQLEELLQSYPKEFLAFFGGLSDFGTPAGYLSMEFFSYMPLVLGIFAVLMGSGLFADDEESGRLDLIMAHPISRAQIFWGRLAAFVVATVGILFISWLGLMIPSEMGALPVAWYDLLLPFVSLLGILLLFATLALFFSQILPSRRMAAMVSGLILVAAFFIDGLARINPDLNTVAEVLPMRYYQGGEALNGLNVAWFLALTGAALVFALLAWWRFERRDIRVGGEGGWRLPHLKRSFRAAKAS